MGSPFLPFDVFGDSLEYKYVVTCKGDSSLLKLILKFAMVGLCSVGVNMLVFMGLMALGANYLLAAACSFAVAVTNNFIGNMLWTFKGRARDKSIQRKYVSFLVISTVNLGVNLLILQLLVEYVKVGESLAQLIAIAMVSGLNFIFNYSITFSQKRSNQGKGNLAAYETDCNTNI
jgi:dolichol-phosphate mannosyltransferase